MTIREGASEEDIKILPKFMFRQSNSIAALSNDKKPKVFRTMMESDNSTSICELCLHPEDSVSISAVSLVYLFSPIA